MSEGTETASFPKQEDVVSSIRSNLTCPICDKLFQDPRILPCLHTFCCQCVENLLRNRPLQDKVLKCPTCGSETGLECRKSTRMLPANSLLVSLLDVLSIQQGESIDCDVCDASEESKAVGRCRECSLYLCGLHEEAHKKARDTKQHVLLSLEHLKSMSLRELNRPTYCATHPQEKVELFCDTCNISICRNCALREHRKHQTQFLTDAYSQLRPRLSELLNQTKSVCITVENAIPMLDWMLARVNLKADNVCHEIEDSINAKISALEQRKKELHAAVELVRINRRTALVLQRRRLEASRDTLRVSCHFVKRVLEEGDPVYLLSAKDLMSQRLEALASETYELQPREDHSIKFYGDNEALQQVIDSFGYVDASYAHFATSTAEGPGLQEASLNQMTNFTVITRDRKGRPFKCEDGDVHAQIEAPDGTKTDADVTASPQNGGKHSVSYNPSSPGQHFIHVTIRGFPMKGSPFSVSVPHETRDYANMNEPQAIIGSPGEGPGQLRGARGVAVDENNRVIVCDRNNFRVQVFDASGKFHFTFGRKGDGNGEFSGGPSSIATSKNGNIIVSDWSGVSVQVFNANGEFLAKLKPNDSSSGGEQFGKFCHLTADQEGRVYVSDYQNRNIYVFSSSGEYLTQFNGGGLAEDDGLVSKPNGIAINSKGEVIVALANDGGFQVFSKDGKPLRRIAHTSTETHNVFVPEAMAVDSNDNILVVDSMKNCLLVFSDDGNLRAECARDHLCNPFGVAVDKVGRVLMTDSSNRIKIF